MSKPKNITIHCVDDWALRLLATGKFSLNFGQKQTTLESGSNGFTYKTVTGDTPQEVLGGLLFHLSEQAAAVHFWDFHAALLSAVQFNAEALKRRRRMSQLLRDAAANQRDAAKAQASTLFNETFAEYGQ